MTPDQGPNVLPPTYDSPWPSPPGPVPGPPGPPGMPGDAGDEGPEGLPGVPGSPGQPGAAGAPGNMGPPGFDGQDGADGLDGMPGQPGQPGAAGPPGDPGQMGPMGLDGQDGSDGLDSLIPGPTGAAGAPGQMGPMGLDGQPGEDISIPLPGPQGPTGAEGRIGPPGMPGLDGAPGDIGDMGVPGPIGPQGLPAQPGAAAYGELTITANATATALPLANTFVKVTAGWVAGENNGCNAVPGAGAIVPLVNGPFETLVHLAVTGTAGKKYIFQVRRNGADITQHTGALTLPATGDGNVTIVGVATFTNGDTIDLWVECTSGAGFDVTITDANFNIIAIAGAQGMVGPWGLDGQDGDSGLDGLPGPQGPAGASGSGGGGGLTSIVSAVSIANTETVIVNFSLPANTMKAGTTFRLTAYGRLTTGATPGSSIFRVRIGTTTLTGNIAVSLTEVNEQNITSIPFKVEAMVTVRTAGAGGTVIGEMEIVSEFTTPASALTSGNPATGAFGHFFFSSGGAGSIPSGGGISDVSAITATVAVDTTATKLIELTYISGNAGSTAVFQIATIETVVA